MNTQKKQPTHFVYHMDDIEHERPLGEAFPHSDGKGYDIDIQMIPLFQTSLGGGEFNGRLTLRALEPKTSLK